MTPGLYWVALGTLNEITIGELDVVPLFCTLVDFWMPMFVALGTFLVALRTVLAIAAYQLVAQGGSGTTLAKLSYWGYPNDHCGGIRDPKRHQKAATGQEVKIVDFHC